jgi:hypothetical protein
MRFFRGGNTGEWDKEKRPPSMFALVIGGAP